MIRFGPMSITLLVCAAQALALAALLLRSSRNARANRYLAALIVAFVGLITPFIIGYAGFYDRWPGLSFAPVELATAFGPLLYLYVAELTGRTPPRVWPHFALPLGQFASQALVFPLPLAVKDHWDTVAHAPYISPFFEWAALLSIALYGWAALSRYRSYRSWLGNARADDDAFDPRWVRNFIGALAVVAAVWAGFLVADAVDPARDYFDQFWLYVIFSGLIGYLGVEGWRHADTRFPQVVVEPHALIAPEQAGVPPEAARDWRAQGQAWAERMDRDGLWRDPELTLAKLAKAMGTNTAYLSQGLNEGLGENFSAVVNRRRVAAVQAALRDPDEGRDLLTLAFDVGFSSKAIFNRAFARFAGMSPSAWRLKS